eukprot:NODE_443_length_1479_cov_149.490210_g327_i0.p1 GENE.NODE_443_length_1479_cov_149.490210_g327_i0~~NODE_443_length_1479_cov_149.490210_g327_i0.p1  ORF type:complete len:402 (+),score=90.41 NODE_443_length_1479_cov_149.490210_g327_i0:45-1250(+)
MARLLALFLAGLLACQDDMDCHLNGICQNGACLCDHAWTGERCTSLYLLPATPGGGIVEPAVSTWGAGVVKRDGVYHMFFSEMVESCGLTSWQTNSRIVHATSSVIDGPYTRKNVTVPIWSHNPAIVQAPDGTLILFHIGTGQALRPIVDGSWAGKCRDGSSPCAMNSYGAHMCNCSCPPPTPLPPGEAVDSSNAGEPEPPFLEADQDQLCFSVAKSPEGPWKPLCAHVNGWVFNRGFNNPAPYMKKNGEIHIVFSIGGDLMPMIRAKSYEGPYEVLGAKACGSGEDPFLYIDKRGNFHCINHRLPFLNISAVAGHAYSRDGINWKIADEPAYSTTVTYTNGTTLLYGKRERPHLLFDDDQNPIALTNGICTTPDYHLCNANPAPGYFDTSFTLIQPVNHP